MSASEGRFDTAFVSASPIALSEAIIRARGGERVVVVEKREDLGGAWRKEDVLGFRDVEVGCHLLLEHPNMRRALRLLWGVELAPLDPEPREVYRFGKRLVTQRYGGWGLPTVVRLLRTGRSGWRWIARRPESRLSEVLRSAWGSTVAARRWLRDARRARKRDGFMYPLGGTGEMVECLARRAAAAGVEFRLGTTVREIDTGDGGSTLRLADGAPIEAEHVLLTRGSSVERIGGLRIPDRRNLRRHWVAVFEDPTPKAFSYLQFVGDPDVRRVSDVTSFARRPDGDPVPHGTKLLCFYVSNALFDRGREIAEARLTALLKEHGWLGREARHVAGCWREDAETSKDYGFLASLEDANPGIAVIRHINLGGYLMDAFPRILALGAPAPLEASGR